MTNLFSSHARTQVLDRMYSSPLDVLIIGGGVTGAGILLDATVRGMKAALVEMQDFAAGTSSRSTKLVHGGLRYLKQFEVGLVAEVGKERAIVYENGPHVTKPEWMLLPIIQGGTYGRLATSVGIRLYDFLAGVRKHERRKMLNVQETLAKEPLLRREGLKGAGYYVEYRTDDARLTLEIIKEAVSRGGLAINYTKAVDLIYDGTKLVGVKVQDLVSGHTHELYARKIVNATGPWGDSLREMDHSKTGKTLHLTKGVHIVIDGQRFPLQNAVYFDVPDGRMVFAIPRDGKVYVGTTDTDYKDDLAHPRMNKADLDYLINAVNFMFPSVHLTAADVESSWAGVRPLIHEEGKDPSEISRKDEIFRSESGLFTIAGGKLTGYRKMAEKVVNLVAAELTAETNRQFPQCTTDKVIISGGHVGGSAGFPAYVDAKVQEGVSLGFEEQVARKLVHRYGSNVEKVYQIAHERGAEAQAHGLSLEVFATLIYAIEHEMAYTPEDYFTRRTSSTYFDIQWARQWKDPVVAYMGTLFRWDDETLSRHKAAFEQRLKEAVEAL
jgi:glycerol-3-phosphate dehydrogenase